MQIKYSKHQRGVVSVLVVILIPLLLFIMGWALDFGHVFVNKTRLQNALDATALSAAIAINADVNHDVAAATAKGKTTFNLFKSAVGNAELKTLNESSLVFEYSNTLKPWGTFNPATDNFAFVRVTPTNMLSMTPVLIKVLGQFNKDITNQDITVPAIATAGPVGSKCNIMPFLLCADVAAGKPLYGYTVGQTRSLLQANCTGSGINQTCQLSAGNFGLLNLLGPGGNDIRAALEGKGTDVCPLNNTLPLNTQPGNVWGPITQGIAYRFNQMDTNGLDYMSPAFADPYVNYLAAGGNKARVMAVPIGDCSGMKTGNATLPQLGSACVFLNAQPANVKGNKYVYAEIIGSCEQSGVFNPNNAALNGPYKIVLFKSPGSNVT